MKDTRRTNSEEEKRESGVPGGGKGRKDEVGHSGVYPMSGPHPAGDAELKEQASWGQGERGAAGYEDHGSSELTWEGGQLLGAVSPGSTPTSKPQEAPEDVDIPHEQWISFLDSFSRQHLNWMATIEVVTAAGRQATVEKRRLQGISIDRGDGRVYVEMETPKGHVTHIVSAPAKIRFRQSLAGAHRGLEITSADGSITMLRFRAMMGPDMLGDIAV